MKDPKELHEEILFDIVNYIIGYFSINQLKRLKGYIEKLLENLEKDKA